MRLLVVSVTTLVLLMGAVPLAVPGTPLRIPGLPPVVSAAAFALAGVALLVGLVLVVRSRRLGDPGEDLTEPVVDVLSEEPADPPAYVTVRTRPVPAPSLGTARR